MEIVEALVEASAELGDKKLKNENKPKKDNEASVSRGEPSIRFLSNFLAFNNYLKSMIAQELLKVPFKNGGRY
jgi:hypothetical protein